MNENRQGPRRLYFICPECGSVFAVRISDWRRRKGIYCSHRCHSDAVRGIPVRPAVERFWEKVDKGESNDCWEWTASVTRGNYGRIGHDGQYIQAHRFSWELVHGSIPDGLCCLHRCDNPRCVNPAHLFLGTDADNVADMIAKGRYVSARGEASGTAKLTEVQVLEIYDRLMSGEPQFIVAEDYPISRSTVRAIKTGASWGWLTGAQS